MSSIIGKLLQHREASNLSTEQGNANPTTDVATDPSTNPNAVGASPTPTPADNPNIEVNAQKERPSLLQSLRDSAVYLSPSEIPSPNEIPAIVAALVHAQENGELPKSPDNNNDD